MCIAPHLYMFQEIVMVRLRIGGLASCFIVSFAAATVGAGAQASGTPLDVTLTFENKTKYQYTLTPTDISQNQCQSSGFSNPITVPAESVGSKAVKVTGSITPCGDANTPFTFNWEFKMSDIFSVPVEYQTWTYTVKNLAGTNKRGSFSSIEESRAPLQTIRGGRMNREFVHCGMDDLSWCGSRPSIGNSADLHVRVVWNAAVTASIAGYANGSRRH
jgi:hypothetical protein